jgi:hypothetical protein
MTSAIELSALELNPMGPFRREAPRPQHLRDSRYHEQFDGLTVFYDCFRTADGRGTIMLGPPLLNLERVVLRAMYHAYGSSRLSRFLRLSRFSVSGYALYSQLRIGPSWDAQLPPGLFRQDRLAVQPNCSEMFRGRRVVLTLSRDNELQWIEDWARFFVGKHGADAVLFYDNGSTNYPLDEIRKTINSISGVAVSCVVDWPYKYGPIAIGHDHWDSNYCQPCAIEHAHHRFLAHAQAVVNCDIDEFPITAGGESIFSIAQRSSTGYLKYDGQWVENASLSPEAKSGRRRHKHFFHRSKSAPYNTKTDPYKWTVMPGRCPADAQWWVHGISQITPDPLSSHVRFRHFKAINTNWSHNRWQPQAPNQHDHAIDEELKEWLEIFDAEQ